MLSRRSEHPTFIVCSGTCPSQRRQAPGGVVRAGFLEEVGVSGQGWEGEEDRCPGAAEGR